MPNIKSPFNPFGIAPSTQVKCRLCGEEILRGTMNWTYSTSAAVAALPLEQRYSHRECIPEKKENLAGQEQKTTPVSTPNNPPQPQNTPNPPDLNELIKKATEKLEKIASTHPKPATPAPAPIPAPKPKSPTEITWEGHHKQMATLLALIDSRTDCYLAGAPGAGKSFSIRSAASILNLRYAYIALSDATMPSAIFGYTAHDAKTFSSSVFYDMYKHGGCLDIAELDNTNSNVFTLLNNALDSGECTFPNSEIVKRHPDFVAIGNGNTFLRGPSKQFPGRQRQDAASIERFVFVEWIYDEWLEQFLLSGKPVTTVPSVPPVPEISIDASKVGEWVRSLRAESVKSERELVVSMRASLKLIKLLKLGFTPHEAVTMSILKMHPMTETILKLTPITF